MTTGEYDFDAIERRAQERWEREETYRIGKAGAKKLYCLDMFPYPSGSGLHLGHPVGYTATDMYCRFKRMMGFDVLHPMGWDAFGLPAEQHAVSTGEHPAIITEKNCDRFRSQMKRIGLSFDWSREIYSCRADYYRWTQWIFLKIYNSWFDEEQKRTRHIDELKIPDDVSKIGVQAIEAYRANFRLAYYADAMVNWCPALGTVLANEEVIDGKSERGGHDVIRKPMKQWMLRITKYSNRLLDELEDIDWPESIKEQQRNWIGKKHGAEVNFKISGESSCRIAVFTTRPDTLFGVTYLVVAPEHKLVDALTAADARERVSRYQEEAKKLSDFARTLDNRQKTGVFTGGYVDHPATGRKLPVYVADYVLASVGTGAVMGVPAHDDRDFEFARTFNLEIKPVLKPVGVSADVEKAVLDGEQAWTEPGIMIASDFATAKELALEGMHNAEAEKVITEWLTERGFGKAVVTYKLRDWLFSRQRYWGEPIPIVHWEDGNMSALDESELPLLLPDVKEYKPSETGESPLARAKDWLDVVDPKTGRRGRRETNTMPQWAGSCWYYLRFIDPKNDKNAWDPELEKAWMPVDLYVGGAEHAVLHLLYSRFWHKVLYDLGYVSTREPFKKLLNQGMLLAHAYKDSRGALIPVDEVIELEDGSVQSKKNGEVLERIVAKMSKSLRNVVTPDEIISQYGADTLRLYIMFMGPLDCSRIYDAKAIVGVHRFLRRVWAWVVDTRTGDLRPFVKPADESQDAKRAMHVAIKKVGEECDNLRFNTAVAALMECLNAVSDKPVSRELVESFILILSPLAPHLTEELWAKLGHSKSVTLEKFPDFDPAILKATSVPLVVQVGGKKRALIDVAVDIKEDDLKLLIVKQLENTDFRVALSDRFITVYQPGTKIPKLVNVLKQ